MYIFHVYVLVLFLCTHRQLARGLLSISLPVENTHAILPKDKSLVEDKGVWHV